jgi:hypothetical protein
MAKGPKSYPKPPKVPDTYPPKKQPTPPPKREKPLGRGY